MSSNRFHVLGLGESKDDPTAQQRAASGRAGRAAGRAAPHAALVQGAEVGLVRENYDTEFPAVGATSAVGVFEPRRGVGRRNDRGREERHRGREERQATEDAVVQAIVTDEERIEAAKKESVKKLVTGKIPSAPEVPKEEQAPKVTAPTPEQIIADKLYIHNFENSDKMMKLYRALQDIQHGTIARPTLKEDNVFHLNLGRGVSLMQLAQEKKNLFCCYHNGAAYCASRMYVSIIRGLVKGIIELQPTSISVSLEVKDVFVPGGDALRSNVEKVVPVFTKYGLRPLEETGKVNKLDREKTIWMKLAKTIERINMLIELKSTDPVIHEIVSFKNILKSLLPIPNPCPMFMNDYIQDHPLFYGWRKRKDLILYANDMLKTEIEERRANNIFGFELSMIDDSILQKTFPNPSVTISSLIEEYPILRKLKMEGDNYAEAKRKTSLVQGHLVTPNHRNFVPSLLEHELARYSQWIQFMRNSYVHFLQNKGDFDENGVMNFCVGKAEGKDLGLNVKDAEGLEDLYRRVFPRAIDIIAHLVAKQERKKYQKFITPTNYWKNNAHYDIWAFDFQDDVVVVAAKMPTVVSQVDSPPSVGYFEPIEIPPSVLPHVPFPGEEENLK